MPVFTIWHGKTLEININKLIWKIFKLKKNWYIVSWYEKKIFVDMHMYEMKKINTTYSIYETCAGLLYICYLICN